MYHVTRSFRAGLTYAAPTALVRDSIVTAATPDRLKGNSLR